MPEPTADRVATPAAGRRCPSCEATLRAGAPWCTLCFTDLRPPPEPPPPPPPEPELDPLTAPLEALGLPRRAPASPDAPVATWPCGTCGADSSLAAGACTACGAGFLHDLRAAEGPLLELPVVGDVGALPRGQRLALAAGVVLVVVVLVLLLGVLYS